MKTLITFLLVILICFTTLAQQGINYKAVIKDDSGNLVTNQTIAVEFSIQQGFPYVNVYTETHSPTTDANGIIILTISNGTVVTGDFNSIDWNSDDHYLNVQIDLGDGNLVDLGTTQFMAVPYALNVTGLEALDEGNGIGWRLKGRFEESYGNIGNGAIDLSYYGPNSTIHGATGENAFAAGTVNIASGTNSTVLGIGSEAFGNRSVVIGDYSRALGNSSNAIGKQSEALGDQSNTIGNNSIADGDNSFAIGNSVIASRDYTFAIGNSVSSIGTGSITLGRFVTAPSFVETVLGSWNTEYTPSSAVNWVPTDRLFTIGNGPGSRSNALTIYKNGNVALGNVTPSSSITENVLDVSGRMRLRPKSGSGSTSGIWYSDTDGTNTQFAGAKTHNTVSTSREWGIYIDGYKFWVNGSGNATLTGSLSQNSDRRLKREITDLSYGLTEILQLQPRQYFWKDKPAQEQASFGLIAQEIEKIIPNILHKGSDDKKILSLSYIELIPVLINAIKEQQDIIDSQKSSLKAEKIINTTQHKQLEALLSRVENLEAKTVN